MIRALREAHWVVWIILALLLPVILALALLDRAAPVAGSNPSEMPMTPTTGRTP